ncbi:ABC transporter substrate-binding protein [Cyanobium sp. WAJ14-Wanaka]|uniref:ABC transporter substrate-binding protein n=1 Tax=Cyanobium sp. WAJ14-Wanaka TaxID=2823725 RepID=UPI0020CC0E0E|nr:extracellular solute-binding protein [Cyanobium sp. WAJ14-Wanaka]MCP9775720.1 extracellular solute-binding protein [Cyanobium sp. WAJ14-Wanaka]
MNQQVQRLSRRQLMALLAGGSAAAALASCGRGKGGNGAGPGADGNRILNVWTLDLAPKFNGYINGVIQAWESQNPGVRVRWTDVPWGSAERKLLAAVFARTAPDLVNLNPPFAANLASKGGLLDLMPLLPSGAASTYLPQIWQAGQAAGAQFALPWYLTTRITMANRRLLEQAGLEQPPSHWEQVPAYAQVMRKRTGRYALFISVVPDDSAELLETFVQMGVQLLDGDHQAAFNSPAGRQAFGFWSDLYRRGLLPKEVVSQGYRRAVELYQAGDLAQVATGPDFLANLQTNAPGVAAHTAPYPPLLGASGDANVAMMNLAVPKQSAMAPEAISFGLMLTNAPNQLAFAQQARVLPSAVAALEELEKDLDQPGSSGPLVQKARLLSAQTLRYAKVLVPSIPGVKRLQAILYTQLQRAMLGELSSDAALAAAEHQWNLYASARW